MKKRSILFGLTVTATLALLGCRSNPPTLVSWHGVAAAKAALGTRTVVARPKSPRPARPWYSLSEIPVRTSLRAFNSAGQGIGTTYLSDSPGSHLHAFLWQEGKTADLGVPGGGVYSGAVALNEQGEVLLESNGKLFLWVHGSAMPVPGLAGDGAINNRGDIVAEAFSAQTRPRGGDLRGTMRVSHAFLRRGGSLVDLGGIPSARSDSTAQAINDQGQVAGESGGHAFLWSAGVMQDLGCLPGYDTAAVTAINAHGQVAGTCTGSQATGGAVWGDAYEEPFLWDHGKMRDLGTLPGCSKTFVRGLNDHGDVIGDIVFVPNFNDRPDVPLLWRQGKIYDLNDLVPMKSGFGLTEPCAINNRGQIACVGYGDEMERGGMAHGYVPRLYLLTPVAH